MARYKDIDAIIEQMNGSTAETWGKGLGRSWWSHSVMLKDNIVQLMNDAPEADVAEVRHGKWIEWWDDNYLTFCYKCSECGEYPLTKEETMHDEVLSKYCPSCGARMDGDEE